MSELYKTIKYKGFKADIRYIKKHFENPLDTGVWDNIQFFATNREYTIGQKKYRDLYDPSDYYSGAEAVREIKNSQKYIYHTFIQLIDYRSNGIRLTRCSDDEATRRFTGFIWITKEQFEAIKADSREYYKKKNIDLRKVQNVCNRYVDDMLQDYVEWCNDDTYLSCQQLRHIKVNSFEHELEFWHEYSNDALEKQIKVYIDENFNKLQVELGKAVDSDMAQLQQYKLVS